MHRVSKKLVGILKEVVSKYHPEWLHRLATTTTPALSWDERDELRSSCASELCDTGLGNDDEPNERGYLLEELIDWLGREEEWESKRDAAAGNSGGEQGSS
jgi:hypothetical protein